MNSGMGMGRTQKMNQNENKMILMHAKTFAKRVGASVLSRC